MLKLYDDFLGTDSEEFFTAEFWLDTYYDTRTGKFRFAKTDDELEKFDFLIPVSNQLYVFRSIELITFYMY